MELSSFDSTVVLHLLLKIPAFCGTRKLITFCTNPPNWSFIPSHLNPVCRLLPSSCQIILKVVLSSTSLSSSRHSHQNPACISQFFHSCYIPFPSVYIWYDLPDYILTPELPIMKFLRMCYFSKPSLLPFC